MQNMKLPKLVIFDMDGLIFDTERLFMEKKAIILEKYGFEARESDYLQTIGLAGIQLSQKLAELYGADYPAQEITDQTRALVNAYMEQHGPDVKPGIPALLQWLTTQGVPCVVASSTHSTFVQKYLKLAHLDSFFDCIIGGEAVSRSKPNPDIFLLACEKTGVKPEDALVFEDSENGVRAADAAHIPVICIPDLKQPSPEIRRLCFAVCECADEVIPFFL